MGGILAHFVQQDILVDVGEDDIERSVKGQRAYRSLPQAYLMAVVVGEILSAIHGAPLIDIKGLHIPGVPLACHDGQDRRSATRIHDVFAVLIQIKLDFQHQPCCLMVSRTKRHFRRDDDFVLKVLIKMMERRPHHTSVLHNYGLETSLPLFVPVFFFHPIEPMGERKSLPVFFADILQQITIKYLLFSKCLEAGCRFLKRVEACFGHLGNQNIHRFRQTINGKAGVVRQSDIFIATLRKALVIRSAAGLDDLGEFPGLQRCPTNESTINIRAGEKFRCVIGLYAAAV